MRGHTTWQPWRFPSGAHHDRLDGTGWLDGGLPRILARNETWLPVVHQRSASKVTAGRDFGMWFYFALGCSDVYFNTGHTLTARNRLHATLLLARQHRRRATTFVAHWLLQRAPRSPFGAHRDLANESVASLAGELCAVARGPLLAAPRKAAASALPSVCESS